MRTAVERFLVLPLILVCGVCAGQQTTTSDAWLQATVLLKPAAKPYLGSKPVDRRLILLPATVTKVDGDWLWLGRAWVMRTEVVLLEEAEAFFSSEIERKPTVAAYRNRGLCRVLHHQQELAAEDFEQALRLDPRDPQTYSYRALCRGTRDEIVAFDDLTEAVCLDPTFAIGYVMRAVGYNKSEAYELALRDLTEAIRIDPSCSIAYELRADIHKKEGSWAQAAADLEEAIRLDGTTISVYTRKALLEVSLRRMTDACNSCTAALKFDPNNSYVYLLRGWILSVQGDSEYQPIQWKPANTAEKPKDNNVNDTSLWGTSAKQNESPVSDWGLRQAMAIETQPASDFPAALRDITRAIELAPKSPEPYLFRGLVYLSQRDFVAALRDFDEAIECATDKIRYVSLRGLTLMADGHWSTAIKELRQAVKGAPDDLQAHEILAYALSSAEDKDARDGELAIQYATKACELTEWKQWRPISLLAAAHAELGAFDKATEYQTKAMSLAPQNEQENLRSEYFHYYYRQPREGDAPKPAQIDLNQWTSTSQFQGLLLQFAQQGGHDAPR